MQSTYIRRKLDIHGKKIVVAALLLLSVAAFSQAQTTKWIKKNNPHYDNRRLTYGFLIGLHTTTFKVKYSDKFSTPALGTLHSVEASWSPGFSLGFLANYKLGDFFDVRITPKVAFYEHRLLYRYTDRPDHEEVVETTFVEFPMLMKYKSERRGNVRMYMIGGLKPGFEASGKKNIENATGALDVKGASVNLDFGFGFDLYYPLFKFSPEIRFSKGLTNMLDDKKNTYGAPLQRLTTNTVTIYFIFQ
jgi:hypothetical protein